MHHAKRANMFFGKWIFHFHHDISVWSLRGYIFIHNLI